MSGKPLAIRLPEDLSDQLTRESTRLGIARSALIVMLLRAGLPEPGSGEQLSLANLVPQRGRRHR